MHLRSGKALNKMTKSANTGASMSSQSLQSSTQVQITRTSWMQVYQRPWGQPWPCRFRRKWE